MVRHGQTPSNVAGAIDTALPGPGLTDLGQRQAASLPDAIGERVASLWASPATRAQLTASPLSQARDLPLRTLDGMFEIQAGDGEMATDAAGVEQYLTTIGAWVAGDLDLRMPGAETGHDVLARVDAALDEVAAGGDEEGHAVVVSHGALIRTWSTIRARNLAPGFIRHNSLGNTGVVELRRDAQGWVCLNWTGTAIGGPGVDDGDPWDGPTGAPVDAVDHTGR